MRPYRTACSAVCGMKQEHGHLEALPNGFSFPTVPTVSEELVGSAAHRQH